MSVDELPALHGILFDLDETLHSRERAFSCWLDEQVALSGAVADRAAIARLDQRGRGDKQRLLEHLNLLFGWGLSSSEWLEHFRSGLSRHLQLLPGLPELLTELRRHYRLGVVTNGASRTQRAKLEILGIASYFDPIVVSEEAGCKKPDERIFRKALDAWNEPAHAILFVGDDPVADIEGARRLGMRAVRVGDGGELPTVLDLRDWLRRPSSRTRR